jgi:hypothetical protein
MEEHKKQSNNSQNLNNMEKQTYFAKVKVTDRLPEKRGHYIVYFKGRQKENGDLFLFAYEYWYFGTDEDKKELLENGSYWLEERELPTDEELKEQALKFVSKEGVRDTTCEVNIRTNTFLLVGSRTRPIYLHDLFVIWLKIWLKSKLT